MSLELWRGRPIVVSPYEKAIWTAIAVILQGAFYSLDGIVTSLLKTPFGQLCFLVNNFKEISEERRRIIVHSVTESNEHCKETFKKFGVLTMGLEINTLLVWSFTDIVSKKTIIWLRFLPLAYFFPLTLAAKRINESYHQIMESKADYLNKLRNMYS